MQTTELRPPHLHRIEFAFGQAYLWRDGDELTLIDTGVPGSAATIAAVTSELGLGPSALGRIIITHGHEDHYGAAAEVREWSGAPVYAHRDDAAVIRGAARRAEPVLTEFDAPIWEQINALGVPNVVSASPVDVELGDGDEISFGGGAQILHVPGHTPGSVAIYLPRHKVLFTGDTLAAGDNGEVILGVFNQDEGAMIRGFHTLAALDVDTACFGHGAPLLAGAGVALRQAADNHQRRSRL